MDEGIIMFETMPSSQPKKEIKKEVIPPEELFGSNVFEVKDGELKRVSEDTKEESYKKELEIPKEIKEEAEKYAEARAKFDAWYARNPQEASRIIEESKEKYRKEYFQMKAKEIERIKKLEEKKKSSEQKEEIIELTEEVK